MEHIDIPIALLLSDVMEKGDFDTARKIISSTLQGLCDVYVRSAEPMNYVDWPFVVAAMRIAGNAITSLLDDSGKQLADELVSRSATMVIDLNELLRQEGKDE